MQSKMKGIYNLLGVPGWLLCTVALLAILPLSITNSYSQHLFILSIIFAILVFTWNILFGFMGVYSFGHQAFFGLGAYVSGLLAVNLGWTPWIGMPLGGAAAVIASLIISWPTFRLKGSYVAIVTLAFAEVLRIICTNWVGLTRGQLGLEVPLLFEGTSRVPAYYMILLIFLATMIVLIKIMHSSFGLISIAIRESQEASESLGIDLVKYKRAAFVLTSFFAGLTGAFYAHYMGVLTPDLLGLQLMFSIIVMGLFGGIGTIIGPVVGAFILTFLSEYLRELGTFRFLVYSLIIIFMVLFSPKGLLGGFERVRRLFKKVRGQDASTPMISIERE